MKSNLFSLIIINLFSLAIVYYIPHAAKLYISYKMSKKAGLSYKDSMSDRTYICFSFIFSIIYQNTVLLNFSLGQAIFILIFMYIAVFGNYVDLHIGIIGNEMLLFMLILALLYRLLFFINKSFIFSLLALFIVLIFFSLAMLIVYLRKNIRGVGMGDVKLAMVIAICVSYPAVLYFMLAMALAMLLYLLFRVIKTPVFAFMLFDSSNSFPMCPPLMFGFLFALLEPLLYNIIALQA